MFVCVYTHWVTTIVKPFLQMFVNIYLCNMFLYNMFLCIYVIYVCKYLCRGLKYHLTYAVHFVLLIYSGEILKI